MKAHRPALTLLFAKKFFRGPSRTGTYQRFGVTAQMRTPILLAGSCVTLANEMDSVEYSGSWLQPFFPPSPSLVATIGLGKSYPVTAAQLLPVSTGFLAPIHFFKLAKNWIDNYPFGFPGSRQIS